MNPWSLLPHIGRTAALLALTAVGLFPTPASTTAGILATPVTVTLNPNGVAPLSAVANFITKIDCLVQIEVQGDGTVHGFLDPAVADAVRTGQYSGGAGRIPGQSGFRLALGTGLSGYADQWESSHL